MPRGVSPFDRAFLQGRLWTPAAIAPSLVTWWDADDLSTITVSTGVSEWKDKSGNGRNLSQATGSQQPALNIGNFNRRNSIRFTKTSSQFLSITNFPTTGITQSGIYFVFTPADDGTIQTYVDNDTQFQGSGIGVFYYDTGASRIAYYRATTGVYTPVTDSQAIGSDTLRIIGGASIGGTGGTDTLFVNGRQAGTKSTTTTLSSLSGFRVGGQTNYTNRWFNGFMCEIIVVSDASAYVRQRIEGYLAHKWGLVSSLYGDHPYLSRPPLIGD